MRLFKGVVPPDPYRGLPSKLHPWVDRCKRYYLEWLFCGASREINFKRIGGALESSIRRAKREALKDFERFTKHLDDRGISEQVARNSKERAKGLLAFYLIDDLEVELQRRGMTLDTANAVFEAIEAALAPTPSTRVGEGRPVEAETGGVVLFLWFRLRADGLSSMRSASRVIAVVVMRLLRRSKRLSCKVKPVEDGIRAVLNRDSESIYQTIRNAERKQRSD